MITYALEPLHNAVGVFSDTLYVPITGVSDSGVYICTAFNSAGTSFTELLVDLSPQGKMSSCVFLQLSVCASVMLE